MIDGMDRVRFLRQPLIERTMLCTFFFWSLGGRVRMWGIWKVVFPILFLLNFSASHFARNMSLDDAEKQLTGEVTV